MEEKERYELFGEHCIKDNSPDVPCQLLDAYKACVILNEQDKEIKHLKRMLQLEEDQKEFIHEEWNTYVRQLNKAKDKDSVSASKQLAIEELEKVKETFTWGKDNGYLTPKNAINIIDNQIKSLKGEK